MAEFPLSQYIKLYWQFFLYSLKRELEFKANFISQFILNIIWYAAQVVFFELIYAHIDAIGPFRREHMHIFLVTIFITDSLWEMLFGNNTAKLNKYITEGELDLLLIKPIPSQFFISCRYVNVSLIFNVIVNFVALFVLLRVHQFQTSPIRIATYLLLCINGTLVVYLTDFFIGTLAVWFRKFSYARWLWFEILKFSHKPDVIYPQLMRKILLLSPPLLAITSIPTRVLIMDYPLGYAFLFPCLTAVFFYFINRLWKRALLSYESASS